MRGDGTTEAMWAALAAGPLAVTDTVPEDTAVRVPRDTGIEFTFDQYGVKASDVAKFFTIKPKVAGTFHAGGRTVAFAPDSPLAKGRLYTVTLRHGLPLAGTGAGPPRVTSSSASRPGRRRRPARPSRSSTRSPTATRVRPPRSRWTCTMIRDGARRPTTIPLTIHRLDGLAAALDAHEAIRDAPGWTLVAPKTPVSTKGLPRVFKGDVKVRKGQEGLRWIQVPRLAAGWYVVTERYVGTQDQLVLQVTDVSAFALLVEGSSAFWVNDLRTGAAAEGATLAIDGKRLGVDRRARPAPGEDAGLRDGDEEIGSRSVLVVRHGGRAAFVPLSETWCASSCGVAVDDWWHTFSTDRYEYRSTDTINAWGIVRDRDDGSVPASVTLTLRSESDWDESGANLAIATLTARPDAQGAFIAEVPIARLPIGDYTLDLTAGDTVLGRDMAHGPHDREAGLRAGRLDGPSRRDPRRARAGNRQGDVLRGHPGRRHRAPPLGLLG